MMAHMEGCIAVIRDSKGNNLREVKGINDGEKDVFLKFGEEYSIYLKNKTSRNVGARISIDGTDVLGGSPFMVPAHGSSEIERFVVDGDLNKGKRFKFVSLASEHEGIVDPDSKDNGLITIEFYREEKSWDWITTPIPYTPIPYYPIYPYPYYHPPYTLTWKDNASTKGSGNIQCSRGNMDGADVYKSNINNITLGSSVGDSCSFSASADTKSNASYCCDESMNLGKEVKSSDGATVEGKASTQKFASVQADLEKTPYVTIKIRLRGHKYSTVVSKDKKHCSKCGSKMDWNFKHCPDCGFCMSMLEENLRRKKFCVDCGSLVEAVHKYCWKCGGELKF